MVDLLLKIIDRLIDFAKHRQEVNKVSFTEFVVPAMADLEAVHKDYLDSFRRYRDMLEDRSIPMTADHPVLRAISRDNLFSEGLRSKILKLDPLMKDEVFGHFMWWVKWYVSGAATPPEVVEYEPWDGISQVRRVRYRRTLATLVKGEESHDAKRTQAIEALDEAVQSLQRYYGNVVAEFADLKTKLLKPL